MDLVVLEDHFVEGKEFVNDHLLEVGHILPLTQHQFTQYFPKNRSFIAMKANRPSAIFSFWAGRDKETPIAWFRLLADSLTSLRPLVKLAEETAVAQERLSLRTSILGYDAKKLAVLKSLGYEMGVSIPGGVSLGGTRYDYNMLYRDLNDQYRFPVKRKNPTIPSPSHLLGPTLRTGGPGSAPSKIVS